MTEIVESRELDGHAASLLDMLELYQRADLAGTFADLRDVYVKTPDGRIFARATIEAETLTDGSKVYNLILGF